MHEPTLQAAYEQAIYEVYSGVEEIRVRIGQCCPQLDTLTIQKGVNSWALVTAYNPHSQCLSASENQQRHQQLIEYLQELKLSYLPAVGKDAKGIWTPEVSLCIFDLELEQAIAIGQKFSQNAIVYGELNEPVELVWL